MVLACTYSAVNHALFVAAIAAMVLWLHGGVDVSRGTLHGGAALLANAALALQFPLLHSFLLSQPGRRLLGRLAPREVSGALAPTTFTLIAGAQLLATFLSWSPSGRTLYTASSVARWILEVLFAASWIFLVKSLVDAKVSIQTGFIGWISVLRGRRPEYGAFPTHGLFRTCRQPVYLAFATTLWTGPVLTLDRLLLAIAWTAYCILGPLHKERRYLAIHGTLYANYCSSVPYILPGFRP
jgi:protein-S-isoprenylcysteine O-methyltransferase Ste14